ncbi:hypothetical protein AB4114_35730, partial [Paenibacillus sp. 2RAB27]|uniref:hypothetical protein n=1 Tax=Paenibacillus sp. 2RAB27 TaxID=3232991 RepID=UPI003F9D49E3
EIDKGIIVESEVIYGNAKLEYALSIKNYMASISVLADYTYDFFISEIARENTFLIKTKQFENLNDLLDEIKEDLFNFSNLDENS